jgi:hypothetical protein
MLLGLAVGAGAALAVSRGAPSEAKPAIARFTIQVPAGTHLPDVPGTSFALSPDGSALVYVGQDEHGTRLFVKRRDELEATAIPGDDGRGFPLLLTRWTLGGVLIPRRPATRSPGWWAG